GRTPGVTSATMRRVYFVAGFGGGDDQIRAEGVPSLAAGVSPRFSYGVTPGYFATMRQPLIAGRDFSAHDHAQAERVSIITQRLARDLWPGQTAIGRRVKLGSADTLPWLTVVGVVGDVS